MDLQLSTAARCGISHLDGGPCAYVALLCPLHAVRNIRASRSAAELEVESAATVPAPIHLNPLMVRHLATSEGDPRRLAAEVLKRVVDGTAAPLQAARFLRASRLLTAMGETEMDNEAALAEAEFRGRLMHGMPPLGEAEWNYARQLFDADTVSEFARWAVMLDAPYPDDIKPAGGYTRAEAREYRNTRFRQQTAPIDPGTTGDDDDDQPIIIRRGPWPGTDP